MSGVIGKIKNSKTGRQFVKFCIVGGINTLVDWAVYYIIVFVVGNKAQVFLQVAKGLSFIVSASTSYAMNRAWTFRSKDKDIVREAIRFFSVAVGGLVINQVAFYIMTASLKLPDITGLIAGTVAATLWNFGLSKRWTFRDQD